MQDKTNNNKRDINNPEAKTILNRAREFQRRAEDNWLGVKINRLKLQDYLAYREPRTELEYVNEASSDSTRLFWIEDNDLVQELANRIQTKRHKLVVRGIMIRDLSRDEEGLVEIELDGESENELIEIS